MIPVLMFIAFGVLVLDFVFVVLSPLFNVASASETREGIARVLRFWGTVSVGVGFLSLLLPVTAIVDYVRSSPDSLLREEGFLPYIWQLRIVVLIVVIAPVAIGYLLRRISRIFQ